MRAITIGEGPEAPLSWSEVPKPVPGPGEVCIRVRATAVNRADLLQRKGLYNPPPGTSDILGLEAAGHIEALGDTVTDFREGQAVCALLAGGGYAEYVTVPAGQVLPIPDGFSMEQAALCRPWALYGSEPLRLTFLQKAYHWGTNGQLLASPPPWRHAPKGDGQRLLPR